MALNTELIQLESVTADPTSPIDGCMWYRSDLGVFRKRENGVTTDLAATGIKTITLNAEEGDTLASTGKTYIASSGRYFLSHSGTGTSADVCGFSFVPEGWTSGAKVSVVFATDLDGVKFVVYKAQITVNNGTTAVSETVTFTKVLTDDTANYEKLETEELVFSSAITDVLTPTSNVTIKVTRDAGDANDDYNGSSYTEFVNFKYNY